MPVVGKSVIFAFALILESVFAVNKIGPYAPYIRQRESIAITPYLDSLWNETERCSGRHGDINRVHFYVVRDFENQSFKINDTEVLAFWLSVDNSITYHQYWATTPEVVKHEMLHALRHNGEHDRHDFITLCGLTTGV